MRLLIDASLPRHTAEVIIQTGHEAIDVRDIGLRSAPDSQVAAHARRQKLAIVTRDGDFGDIRNYPPADYHGIIVLRLPDDSVTEDILRLLASFLKSEALLAQLPGCLAVVEPGHVRIRSG